jgi:hypothetical protein
VIEKATRKIICVSFASGRRHDFRLFKESGVRFRPGTVIKTDTGYQGIHKFHGNSVLPRKRTKKKPLTAEDRAFNRSVSSARVLNEHIIGHIKRFKIVADRYRNRRKRFGLRFNLIAGICNFELTC